MRSEEWEDFLSRLRKELVRDAQNYGVDLATLNVCISFGEKEEGKDARTVIDDYELVDKIFSAKYVFVTNRI